MKRYELRGNDSERLAQDPGELKEKIPADIGNMIAARGGFYDSGHDDVGEQYKLPIDAVF